MLGNTPDVPSITAFVSARYMGQILKFHKPLDARTLFRREVSPQDHHRRLLFSLQVQTGLILGHSVYAEDAVLPTL